MDLLLSTFLTAQPLEDLDRAKAALDRLVCYEQAATKLHQADLLRARAKPGTPAYREAGAKWLDAYHLLFSCRTKVKA